jgi:Peptidase of plants and bacteria
MPLVVGAAGLAQARGLVQAAEPVRDTISKGKYTLYFISKEPGFNPVTRQKMIDAFFKVYPEEARRFNSHTLRQVTFVIDPAYDGVAATGNGVATYNPGWLKSHPEDIDVVTHEVMHIVQDYRHENPGWLTEGIADYVRYTYGVNNMASQWKLPDYRPAQHYTNAYRVTARFLVWVEQHKNKHVVDRLDAALRAGTYQPELWVTLTGKTVDELWDEYGKNPQVQLKYM